VTFDPDSDGADLVDWPPAMRYGYDVDTVARTTANVLAADTFARVAEIGSIVGDRSASVSNEQTRHDKIVAAINAKLTRTNGVYVDGLKANGAPSPHASQQASEFALTFGIVPAAKVAAVGKYVANLGIETGPMDGLYLLDGLQAAGRPADVVKVLTDTKDPGWANIVAQGGTFVWESWILYDIEGDGMSHGWGSSALPAFQTSILGVTLVQANPAGGTTIVSIDAPTAGPDHVEGRVPTIAGPIDVRWQRTGGHVQLHLTVPPNAAARVNMLGKVAVVGSGTYNLTN
jgi:alpha-L-rhamnosidase